MVRGAAEATPSRTSSRAGEVWLTSNWVIVSWSSWLPSWHWNEQRRRRFPELVDDPDRLVRTRPDDVVEPRGSPGSDVTRSPLRVVTGFADL